MRISDLNHEFSTNAMVHLNIALTYLTAMHEVAGLVINFARLLKSFFSFQQVLCSQSSLLMTLIDADGDLTQSGTVNTTKFPYSDTTDLQAECVALVLLVDAFILAGGDSGVNKAEFNAITAAMTTYIDACLRCLLAPFFPVSFFLTADYTASILGVYVALIPPPIP